MTENLAPELQNQQEDLQPATNTEPQLSGHQALTKEEIVKKIKELLEQDDLPARADIDSLKQAFYKLRTSETDELRQKFLEEGGDLNEFVITPDPAEEEIKTLLNTLKEKRAKLIAEEEKIKEENLAKKIKIIDAIKDLTESQDDFNKLYKEFKNLQQEWNEIKVIPQASVKDVWRSYQIYTEKFYDLIKINNELRDYDFKKNLELKTAICEAVEKLEDEPDVVSAFYQLQNFHQQWRDIGPVAKELREDIWTRFKEASTKINKRYQEHFEELKQSEEANLAEKQAICETLKNIDYTTLVSFKDWDEKTKEVIELQEKWRTIGFVPRKVNNQIFAEFRALCDTFFEKKGEYFKAQREEMQNNLEKKKALCEKAKELKDSTDWKKTTDALIAIQKEWKTIGPVPRKYSDSLWKEFVTACDYFFEQKNKTLGAQKEEEVTNLNLKKEIIKNIQELDVTLDSEELLNKLRAYMDEWQKVGFVPFREKDRLYKEYHAAVDEHFDRLKVDKAERRLQNFKNSLDDISKSERPRNKLHNEKEKLMYQYNRIKAELQTYENNMGFLTVSKGAGGLLKEMNHKIESLRNELDLIVKKIDAINENLG